MLRATLNSDELEGGEGEDAGPAEPPIVSCYANNPPVAAHPNMPSTSAPPKAPPFNQYAQLNPPQGQQFQQMHPDQKAMMMQNGMSGINVNSLPGRMVHPSIIQTGKPFDVVPKGMQIREGVPALEGKDIRVLNQHQTPHQSGTTATQITSLAMAKHPHLEKKAESLGDKSSKPKPTFVAPQASMVKNMHAHSVGAHSAAHTIIHAAGPSKADVLPHKPSTGRTELSSGKPQESGMPKPSNFPNAPAMPGSTVPRTDGGTNLQRIGSGQSLWMLPSMGGFGRVPSYPMLQPLDI